MNEIAEMMARENRTVIYQGEYYDEIYRDKRKDHKGPPYQFIQDGFLDPYYNL